MTDEKSALDILRESYSSLPELRALVQVIPVLGGSIDTLIVGRTGQIQLARIERFVRLLSARLRGVERSAANLSSEAFSDLVSSTFQKVALTRSEAKRARFAQILHRQVMNPCEWEEAEAAVRLLAELEDIHVAIMNAALTAPQMAHPFAGLRVVSPVSDRSALRSEIMEAQPQPLYLPKALPQYGLLAIGMAASDLLSRGLLHDEGVGRLGTRPMDFLVATDQAKWFANWISESLEEMNQTTGTWSHQ